MDFLISVDEERGQFAKQVTTSLREAIRSRRLLAGARLPSTRSMAADLGVSRGVVVEAYAQLTAEGYLVTRSGSGTRVAFNPTTPARSKLARPSRGGELRYDMRFSAPDLSTFPRSRWLWAMRTALASLPHSELGYADSSGVTRLREELTLYLRRVACAACNVDQITVVAGVAQGLVVALRVLARRGRTRLAVEDPSAFRMRDLLKQCGFSLIGVPVDEEGLDVRALDRTGADVVLVTPAHQFPTGVVLSARRRTELTEWAQQKDGIIIEDSYDAEFRYDRDPVGCLQGIAPDRVFFTGSVSKSLSPGLRLGWLVAPPRDAEEVRAERTYLDLGSPVLDQYALAQLLSSEAYDRHLRAVRRRYRARRDALVKALGQHLPAWRIHGVAAGLHLYAELPEGTDADELTARAARRGVGVEAIGPMRLDHPGPPALVLGYAHLDEEELTAAVRLLARLHG